MEEDLMSMPMGDLQLLFDTFSVIRNPSQYKNSEVQNGFKLVFSDADQDGHGFVDRRTFQILIDGYFGSKHIRPTNADYEEYFKKIDLNQDGKISFEDYDVFIRIVYETEYLPALEKEIARRTQKKS